MGIRRGQKPTLSRVVAGGYEVSSYRLRKILYISFGFDVKIFVL